MRHGRISRNDKRRALLRADTRLSLQLLDGEADSLHCRHPDLLKPLRLILRIENPRQDILPKPDLRIKYTHASRHSPVAHIHSLHRDRRASEIRAQPIVISRGIARLGTHDLPAASVISKRHCDLPSALRTQRIQRPKRRNPHSQLLPGKLRQFSDSFQNPFAVRPVILRRGRLKLQIYFPAPSVLHLCSSLLSSLLFRQFHYPF